MLPVFEAVERSVIEACRTLGMDATTIRKLIRVEINSDTMQQIYGNTRHLIDFSYDDIRRTQTMQAPLIWRDVSFYLIHHAEVPWKVIALRGRLSGGFEMVEHIPPYGHFYERSGLANAEVISGSLG